MNEINAYSNPLNSNKVEIQPTKQVLDQLERFDKYQVRTKELLDLLEQSLTGVLRGAAPEVASDNQPKDSLVPIAEQVRRDTETQANLNGQIESILQRLEV